MRGSDNLLPKAIFLGFCFKALCSLSENGLYFIMVLLTLPKGRAYEEANGHALVRFGFVS
jgi:hypothetical protein